MCALLKGLVLGGLVLLVHSAHVAHPVVDPPRDVAATLKHLRECIVADQAVLCLKERALSALNETIRSTTPITIYGGVEIVRDPAYVAPDTSETNLLPRDLSERSAKLNELIYDRVEDFLNSRSIQIRLGDVFEGRGKKDKNKGGMLMMGGLAMAGMMAQMFMGKIAFMAGAALLLAKLALLLSTIIGFKKLAGGGGGGESTQVVYSGSSDGGYGGAWHRSIAGQEANAAQSDPYRGHMSEVADNYFNYTY